MPLELGLAEGNSDVIISQNAGKITNKGIEAMLSYRGEINDFRYTISGNVSKIWNEITDLKGNDNQISGKWINKVGESIGLSICMKQMESSQVKRR